MRNLLKADLSRILRLKLLYIALFLGMLNIAMSLANEYIKKDYAATAYVSAIELSFGGVIMALSIVVPVFYMVYFQEFLSRSMICLLGWGLSRGKLVVSRLLIAAVLLFCIFVILAFFAGIFSLDPTLGVSNGQKGNLLIFICLRYLRYLGYIIFSGMAMYLTNSAVVGIIASSAFALFFRAILAIIELMADISIYDYTFDGLLDWAYTTLCLGGFAWQLIPALCYVAVAIAVTIHFFKGKEFEF